MNLRPMGADHVMTPSRTLTWKVMREFDIQYLASKRRFPGLQQALHDTPQALMVGRVGPH